LSISLIVSASTSLFHFIIATSSILILYYLSGFCVVDPCCYSRHSVVFISRIYSKSQGPDSFSKVVFFGYFVLNFDYIALVCYVIEIRICFFRYNIFSPFYRTADRSAVIIYYPVSIITYSSTASLGVKARNSLFVRAPLSNASTAKSLQPTSYKIRLNSLNHCFFLIIVRYHLNYRIFR